MAVAIAASRSSPLRFIPLKSAMTSRRRSSVAGPTACKAMLMVSANELIDASLTSIADAPREILKFGFGMLFSLQRLGFERQTKNDYSGSRENAAVEGICEVCYRCFNQIRS